MAKGGRGGRRGKGGGGATGELTLPDGSKIEFEGTLHFDGDDAAVTGVVRKNITDWETKRVKNKIEYAYSVDANGNPIGKECKGGKGSVRVPHSYHDTDGATFTHVHPRNAGMLGGTFSSNDLHNFANNKNVTVRAAAKEGTYSISKTAKFDKTGFNNYANKCNSNFNTNYRKQANEIYNQYRAGKISYDGYLKGNAKAFNTALVTMHNELRAGQKQYGYTYTLEKRG